MSIRKTVLVAAAAFSFIAVTGIANYAEAAPVSKSAKVSRGKVDKACTAAGGTVWGTGRKRSKNYGCVSEEGWIFCKRNGKCEGGSNSKKRVRSKKRVIMVRPIWRTRIGR